MALHQEPARVTSKEQTKQPEKATQARRAELIGRTERPKQAATEQHKPPEAFDIPATVPLSREVKNKRIPQNPPVPNKQNTSYQTAAQLVVAETNPVNKPAEIITTDRDTATRQITEVADEDKPSSDYVESSTPVSENLLPKDLDLDETDQQLAEQEISESEHEVIETYYSLNELAANQSFDISAFTKEDSELENTLAQLAEYLSLIQTAEASQAQQALEEVEVSEKTIADSEVKISKQISVQEIQELRDVLTKIGVELKGPDQKNISPALTKELLKLLRIVGYPDPQTTLMEFVEKYSLKQLLQSMRYLYQLSNDDEQKEFLSPTAMKSLAATDESLTLRLGRAIFSLTKTKYEAPEPA